MFSSPSISQRGVITILLCITFIAIVSSQSCSNWQRAFALESNTCNGGVYDSLIALSSPTAKPFFSVALQQCIEQTSSSYIDIVDACSGDIDQRLDTETTILASSALVQNDANQFYFLTQINGTTYLQQLLHDGRPGWEVSISPGDNIVFAPFSGIYLIVWSQRWLPTSATNQFFIVRRDNGQVVLNETDTSIGIAEIQMEMYASDTLATSSFFLTTAYDAPNRQYVYLYDRIKSSPTELWSVTFEQDFGLKCLFSFDEDRNQLAMICSIVPVWSNGPNGYSIMMKFDGVLGSIVSDKTVNTSVIFQSITYVPDPHAAPSLYVLTYLNNTDIFNTRSSIGVYDLNMVPIWIRTLNEDSNHGTIPSVQIVDDIVYALFLYNDVNKHIFKAHVHAFNVTNGTPFDSPVVNDLIVYDLTSWAHFTKYGEECNFAGVNRDDGILLVQCNTNVIGLPLVDRPAPGPSDDHSSSSSGANADNPDGETSNEFLSHSALIVVILISSLIGISLFFYVCKRYAARGQTADLDAALLNSSYHAA